MSHFNYRGRLFLERLAGEVLVGDGAMGTLLYSRGVSLDTNFEYLNLTRPELVQQVHHDYVKAGAQLLETNTFRANALCLGAVGLEKKVREVNLCGARLARAAAGEEVFVAGSVGPLVRPRGRDDELSASQKKEIFREQMEALAEGGVDLFILETFSSLEDMEQALFVAGQLDVPAIAQMAFLEQGCSRSGVSAEDAARCLVGAGASVLGANCGSGPHDLLSVLKRMAQVSSCPLSAFANSGFPQHVNGRNIYLATPEYFASMGKEMVQAGASLVGGCCGTTPEHIRLLAQTLHDIKPVERPARIKERVPEAAPKESPVSRRQTFLDQWGKKPVITVELDPPRGLNCSKVLDGARRLAEAGVDAINLAENPLARIRMGNIALAKKIQDAVGIDVIVHVTCRDRNLIGLHSEMMGAHLLGIKNILAVTGDPVSIGGEAGATNVFDLNSVGLLELLDSMNHGKNMFGTELEGSAGFLLGAAFNPNVVNMEGQIRRLKKKIAAGASFVQTQPVYSQGVLEEMLDRTASLGVPVLVGILPLVSERNAEFLHNEVPGITLPVEVRQRMKGKKGAAGVEEGMAIARELIQSAVGRAGGFYIMPPFGKVELAVDLLEVIRSAHR